MNRRGFFGSLLALAAWPFQRKQTPAIQRVDLKNGWTRTEIHEADAEGEQMRFILAYRATDS